MISYVLDEHGEPSNSVPEIEQAIIEQVRQRISEHNRTVRQHGGAACQDDFCRTFKPLIRQLNAAKRFRP